MKGMLQCSNQLSYEVTQWRAGQFVGLNKLTCSPLCDFIAQLVRALHRRRRMSIDIKDGLVLNGCIFHMYLLIW